jgi:hypothetical protein
LASDVLLLSFAKLLEHSWKPFFYTSVSAIIGSVVTSPSFANICPFQNTFYSPKQNRAVTIPWNMADAPRPSHCAWQGTLRFIVFRS